MDRLPEATIREDRTINGKRAGTTEEYQRSRPFEAPFTVISGCSSITISRIKRRKDCFMPGPTDCFDTAYEEENGGMRIL